MTPGLPRQLAEERAHVRRLCRLARAQDLEDLLADTPPCEVVVILLHLQRLYPGPAPIPIFRVSA